MKRKQMKKITELGETAGLGTVRTKAINHEQ